MHRINQAVEDSIVEGDQNDAEIIDIIRDKNFLSNEMPLPFFQEPIDSLSELKKFVISKESRSYPYPGLIIERDCMSPRNISPKDFAKILGWTTARLNKILNGSEDLCADEIIKICICCGKHFPYDLHVLQQNYTFWMAAKRHNENVDLLNDIKQY